MIEISALQFSRNFDSKVELGESDWKAIEETLYLNRIPGLVASIKEAAAEPLSEGMPLEELEW